MVKHPIVMGKAVQKLCDMPVISHSDAFCNRSPISAFSSGGSAKSASFCVFVYALPHMMVCAPGSRSGSRFSLRFSIAGAHILRYYTMSGWHEPPDTSSLIRL